jgi:hypothetical protein
MEPPRDREVPLDSPTTVRSVVVPVATFPGVRTGDLKLTVKTSRKPVKIEGLGVGR